MVMNSLVAGIVSNLKYEKESTVIINGLSSVLRARTRGRKGSITEVSIHNWMLDNLENCVGNWFRRPNTIVEVRQSIVGLINSILPIDNEKSSESHQTLQSSEDASGNDFIRDNMSNH